MRLGHYIDIIKAGGPGSGCNGENCGRPPGPGHPENHESFADRLKREHAEQNSPERLAKRAENTKEVGKLAKSLKLPAGSGVRHGEHEYSWTKNGGYADKQISKVREAAMANGFQKVSNQGHASPGTGNVVGDTEVYEKGNFQLTLSKSYGVTKESNSFSIALTRK